MSGSSWFEGVIFCLLVWVSCYKCLNGVQVAVYGIDLGVLGVVNLECVGSVQLRYKECISKCHVISKTEFPIRCLQEFFNNWKSFIKVVLGPFFSVLSIFLNFKPSWGRDIRLQSRVYLFTESSHQKSIIIILGQEGLCVFSGFF